MENNINTLLNSLSNLGEIRKADKNNGEYSSTSDNTMSVGTKIYDNRLIVTQNDLNKLAYQLYQSILEGNNDSDLKNSDTSTDYVFTAAIETEYTQLIFAKESNKLYYLDLNIQPEKFCGEWYVDLPTDVPLDILVKNDIIRYLYVEYVDDRTRIVKLQYGRDYIFEEGCSLNKTKEWLNNKFKYPEKFAKFDAFPILVSYDDEDDEDDYDE